MVATNTAACGCAVNAPACETGHQLWAMVNERYDLYCDEMDRAPWEAESAKAWGDYVDARDAWMDHIEEAGNGF